MILSMTNSFKFCLQYVKFWSYQSKLHYHRSHTRLSNEYLLFFTFIQIKIYFTCPILYFRQITSQINFSNIFVFQNCLKDWVALKILTNSKKHRKFFAYSIQLPFRNKTCTWKPDYGCHWYVQKKPLVEWLQF